MSIKTWAMARKEGLSLAMNGGTVALAVAALVISAVSTVVSWQATQASQVAAEAARDSVELTRQANEASAEQARLQGALPELIERAVVDGESRDVSMPSMTVSASTGQVDGVAPAVINRGLAETNVQFWVEFDVVDDSGQLLMTCESDVSSRELPAQSTTTFDFAFICPGVPVESSIDRVSAYYDFGTGNSVNSTTFITVDPFDDPDAPTSSVIP